MHYLAPIMWVLFLSLTRAYAEPVEDGAQKPSYPLFVQRVRQMELQDRDAALAEVERAIVVFPDRVGLALKRCELLLDLGRAQLGGSCLQQVEVRFPSLDATWQRVLDRLRDRVLPARTLPLRLVSSPVVSGPAARQPRGRRWWLWSGLCVGTAGLGLGLALGLIPRPHGTVSWGDGGMP